MIKTIVIIGIIIIICLIIVGIIVKKNFIGTIKLKFKLSKLLRFEVKINKGNNIDKSNQ